jgi:vacuolar protein sorting-associated protein 54
VFVDRQDTSMVGSQLMMGNFRIIRSEIIIDHRVYKVTETLLLMLEIIEDYLHLAQFYPFARKEVGIKVFELLRAYNTSSSQLIIFGGAVKLQKIKNKSITARHLALNSLCLSFLLYIMDCIIKRVPIYEEDKIRKDIEAQEDMSIKKLNSILTSKVTQSVSDINLNNVPSKGTEAIVNNTKTLHDILVDFF